MTGPRIAEGRHEGRLGYYDFGATPYFASRHDQRFSYCLYVPSDYDQDGDERLDLLVLVHGTARWAEHYREAFSEFAQKQRLIVLAPLFPAGMTAPGELSSYKLLRHGGIDYDRVLLGMVEEVTERYRLREGGFYLHGFSGGGHFAHRFLYLHPGRLAGVSVGAPGIVTLIDPGHDFWVGVRDFEAVFGKPLDIAAIRRVPVHLVVGGEDTETWEIALTPADDWWMEGAERLANANRVERIAALRESHGVSVEPDIVEGAGHDGRLMLDAVRAWLERTIMAQRDETGASA